MNSSGALKLRSRRALFAGAAGAGTVLVAGCGGKPLREKIRSGARVSASDVRVLNRLLDVENYGIAAYAVGIPLMSVGAQAIGKQFLAQEQSHAVELGDLIRGAGAKPNKPPASYDVGDPRNQADAFALIERAERRQLEAYLQMIPSVSGGLVRAALATIFANDAQHLAVVRVQSGQSLPGAFTLT